MARGFSNPEVARKAGQKSSNKGLQHEKTKQWEALANDIITIHAERFNRALNKLSDEDFIKAYKDILNYFKPRIVHNINQDFDPSQIKGITFDKD